MTDSSKATIKQYLTTSSAYGPDFSPSGKKVVYLTNCDTDTPQVYLKDLVNDSVQQVTNYEDGIDALIYSPVDEDLILFSKSAGGNERYQIFLKDLKNDTVTELTNNKEARFNFSSWSRDGRFIQYASTERNGEDYDIYSHELKTGERQVIYKEGGNNQGMGFSPKGTYSLISHAVSNVDNSLFLVKPNNPSGPQRLLPHEGIAAVYRPIWNTDESGFFYLSDEARDKTSLFYYDLVAQTSELVLGLDWEIDTYSMDYERTLMTVQVNESGFTKVYFYNVDGKTITPNKNYALPDGETGQISFSKDGNRIICSNGRYDQPYNVWVWDKSTNTCRNITNVSSAIDANTFVKPKLVRFKSFDDLTIEAFLYLPEGNQKSLPTIINVHGGPEEQYRDGFKSLTQYFVAQGYAVICPNVRGSSGYGKRFMSLDDRHKRLDSVEDLRALHTWAANDPRIDETRIALMGGSYGGYMVLAGLAFQPELWAAGVDIVGIANFVSFLQKTAPYRRKLREAEYGSLEHDREFLEKISPINKADAIKAPLLIIHGANDPRVPLNEAEQIHKSLNDRGVETELLVYDDEGHGIAKLKNRLDAYSKVAEFLDSVLK